MGFDEVVDIVTSSEALLDEAQTLPSEEADREMMMRTVLKAYRTGA